MTKAELAKILDARNNEAVGNAAETYCAVVCRLDPSKWNYNTEAGALLELLTALEQAGCIKIIK